MDLAIHLVDLAIQVVALTIHLVDLTIHYPLSGPRYPLSGPHYPLSTIHVVNLLMSQQQPQRQLTTEKPSATIFFLTSVILESRRWIAGPLDCLFVGIWSCFAGDLTGWLAGWLVNWFKRFILVGDRGRMGKEKLAAKMFTARPFSVLLTKTR